jgi:hypothetical protein
MSGSSVVATGFASSNVYPPVCSSECASTAVKQPSSSGCLAKWASLSTSGRNTACSRRAPRPVRTQVPLSPSTVRAHRPTDLDPKAELQGSSTMLQTFLSTKNS